MFRLSVQDGPPWVHKNRGAKTPLRQEIESAPQNPGNVIGNSYLPENIIYKLIFETVSILCECYGNVNNYDTP